MIPILSTLGGLVLLALGAELLVRGASRLAAVMGVAPLLIGLTIVAFGTSTPELAVSIRASLTGHTEVALGNAVGSNTFNVLFILGLSALIAPLSVKLQLIKFDLPVMVAASLLLLALALDGRLGRLEGVLFVALLIAYTWVLLRMGKREKQAEVLAEFEAEFGPPAPEKRGNKVMFGLMIVAGLGILLGGMHLLLEGATTLARQAGVSERVIGLTLIAGGTSLPELLTSAVAAWKGERDIAIGNVVGSNVFNILGVLGVSATVAELQVPDSVLRVDIPVAIVAAAVCVPVFITGRIVSRWEGAAFVAAYVVYVALLIARVI